MIREDKLFPCVPKNWNSNVVNFHILQWSLCKEKYFSVGIHTWSYFVKQCILLTYVIDILIIIIRSIFVAIYSVVINIIIKKGW